MLKSSKYIVAFLLIGLVSPIFSQEIMRNLNTNHTFQKKWDWAVKEAKKGSSQNGFWIGFSIDRKMYEKEYWWMDRDHSGHMYGTFTLDGDTSLHERLYGISAPKLTDDEQIMKAAKNALLEAKGKKVPRKKVQKEIAILFGYLANTSNPKMPEYLGMINTELNFDQDGASMFWLGKANQKESLGFLKQMYQKLPTSALKRRMISLIGVHQQPEEVLPFFEKILLSESSDKLREEVVEWLSKFDTDKSFLLLKKAIKSDDSRKVREEAVESLGELSLSKAETLLIEIAQNDAEKKLRQAAVEGLSIKNTARIRKVLEKITFNDAHKYVQEEAFCGIAHHKDEAAFQFTKKVLNTHPRTNLQEEALAFLYEYFKNKAVPVLVTAYQKHPKKRVRQEAIELLANIAAKKAIETLSETVDSGPELRIKYRALATLVDMETDESLNKLIDISKNHKDRNVRKRAILFLGDSRNPRAHNALIEILKSE